MKPLLKSIGIFIIVWLISILIFGEMISGPYSSRMPKLSMYSFWTAYICAMASFFFFKKREKNRKVSEEIADSRDLEISEEGEDKGSED